MIGIGINKDVILTGVSQDADKGMLTLVFDEAQNLGKEVDLFAQMESAKVENTGSTGTKINIFPFKKPSGPKNENKTVDELLKMISDDMNKTRVQLNQLLQQFLTEADIKWDVWAKTGVTDTNYREKWLEDDALRAIFDNYAQQFIQMITPFLGNTAYKLRLKLARQSAEKNFPTLPGRYLADNPFVDLMDVPDDATKVKFTKWEIDNKYNDSTPVAKPNAATEGMPAGAPAEAKDIFNER